MTEPGLDISTPAIDVPLGFGLELSGKPDASLAARRARLASYGALPTCVRDDVLLLVSELVTNAVRHADAGPEPTVRVELQRWPNLIRVAVLDEGTGFSHPKRFRRDDSGGWGLYLVDRIADRWAVTRTTSGTCVWFEIDYEE
jgi:anti-sigma regulatory factor (Ser/Thr protein kinase)